MEEEKMRLLVKQAFEIAIDLISRLTNRSWSAGRRPRYVCVLMSLRFGAGTSRATCQSWCDEGKSYTIQRRRSAAWSLVISYNREGG